MNWILRKGIDFIILLAVIVAVGIFVCHASIKQVGIAGLLTLVMYIIVRRKRFRCKKK